MLDIARPTRSRTWCTDPEIRDAADRHGPALRRARGDPGRVRARARRRVSRRDRRADEGAGPVRRHDPRGVRRARARPAHVHRRRRGARVRLDVAVGHRQHAHDRARRIIVRHGTEEQKQRWLPRLATGELRGCLSLSEPDAGSDTRNISCRADARRRRVRDHRHEDVGDQRRAGRASSRSRRAPTRASRASSSRRSPGPTFGGITRRASNIGKLGYKGIETVEMVYDGHRVPADALLGDAGRGLGYILGALEVGRINIAARAVGVARAAFDAAIRVRAGARHVRQADRRAPGDPAEARRHGDQARGRAPAHPQRGRAQAGRASAPTSRPAWRSCSRARPRSRSRPRRCASTAASATRPSCPIERYYRDAPLMIIGEGTNEIQRLVIARGLLARARRAVGSLAP